MRKPVNPISFHFLVPRFNLHDRTPLKAFIYSHLNQQTGRDVNAVNYIFCSDEYLLDINQQFLKHDTLTDIITFDYNGAPDPIQADVYVSIPRVRENALKFNQAFQSELMRVLFHGALHIIGHKDKTKKQVRLMRHLEDELLAEFAVSRGTFKMKN